MRRIRTYRCFCEPHFGGRYPTSAEYLGRTVVVGVEAENIEISALCSSFGDLWVPKTYATR
jgi:hypothetical protein